MLELCLLERAHGVALADEHFVSAVSLGIFGVATWVDDDWVDDDWVDDVWVRPRPEKIRLTTNTNTIPLIIPTGRLLRGRIVPSFGINMERRQSFWRKQLHLYLMPFAVMPWVGWTVSEYILVA